MIQPPPVIIGSCIGPLLCLLLKSAPDVIAIYVRDQQSGESDHVRL
jgi:hypothetical protein